MSKPWEIIHGDVSRVAKTLERESFDAMLCDPPYGLSFMGRRWDYSVPSALTWSLLERALRPGAHAIIFGGSRTFHRMTVAVEDGGFEIRDCFCWLYGQGFPKSTDVARVLDEHARVTRPVIGTKRGVRAENGSGHGAAEPGRKKIGIDIPITAPVTDAAKAWDGYGSALKPSWEPAILARKYLDGTIAENVLAHGVGGIAIDASRVGRERGERSLRRGATTGSGLGFNGAPPQEVIDGGVARHPANVILDEAAAAMLDEQAGESATSKPGTVFRKTRRDDVTSYNLTREPVGTLQVAYGDFGGPSRFFYTAKASSAEREAGLEEREASVVGSLAGGGVGASDPVSKRFTKTARNVHPTVKPIDLIRYLARLILPPRLGRPRRILVPYSGSGSEMIGCMQAGWDEVVGIEREAEYVEIARGRIQHGGVLSSLHRERERSSARGSGRDR